MIYLAVHKLAILKQILHAKLADKRGEELKKRSEILKMEALEEEMPGWCLPLCCGVWCLPLCCAVWCLPLCCAVWCLLFPVPLCETLRFSVTEDEVLDDDYEFSDEEGEEDGEGSDTPQPEEELGPILNAEHSSTKSQLAADSEVMVS